jgi:hypothetical protein
MPNWVYNKLEVAGDEALIAQFKEQASRPVTRDVYDFFKDEIVRVTREEPLSFWNFKRPSDDILEWYCDKGWYEWNLENWDTKWDACDAQLDEQDSKTLCYSFNTAWSIPELALEAMVSAYPNLSFYVHAEEEQGWGSEYAGYNGVLEKTNDWDIPEYPWSEE